ncbi:MAG: hypothetical protein ACI9KE_004772 [Polyangiales bacterium]
MVARFFILVVCVIAQSAVQANAQQAPFAYDLRAELVPSEHLVRGEGSIKWTNTSSVPIDRLVFHLYLNAFSDEESVFMRESGGQLRGDTFHGEGSIDVEALHIGTTDLLDGAETELVENDRTQLRVLLPAPVAPGASITVETQFTSRLPPVFARSGYAGEFHMVAQWFPKIARLEPDGTWASFPYHAHGEFYADFATYELEVRTPLGWRVGATGRAAPPEEDGDALVHRFSVERVHDTAFAAAPWFEEDEANWELDGHSVYVRVLSPPGYGSAVARHLQITEAAIRRYGRLFGHYPYDSLTIIVPPANAPGAAGMEYPTLFVTAGPWWTTEGMPFRAPIGLQAHVTAHELGHQWFQGMIGTNEVDWPMLDEGLTEWVTCDFLTARYGNASAAALPFVRFPAFETERVFGFGGAPSPPPGRPVHAFHGSEYGRSVYARSTSIFETVARTWGRRRFQRALGRYARRHRYGHPGPEDLFRAMDEEYGAWMSRRVMRPALLHGAQAVVHVEVEENEDGWRLDARRYGGLPLPSHIHVETAAGESTSIPWPGSSTRLSRDFAERPRRVLADPHHHNLTDPRRADDGMLDDNGGYFPRALWVVQNFLSAAVGP